MQPSNAFKSSDEVSGTGPSASPHRLVRWMTYLMFFVFAMTTDAVGVIIPNVVERFGLSLTEAAAFHYVPMACIGFSGLLLGRMADVWGRKPMILAGLALYVLACWAFMLGDTFLFYLLLLGVSGIAIGLFKTGALALLGDISSNPASHTMLMNRVEGFFALGAIVGPLLVTMLLAHQFQWTQLYLIAGGICALLLLVAAFVRYPAAHLPTTATQPRQWLHSVQLLRDPFALGFALAIAFYVMIEVAVFVWLPTLLKSYQGNWQWLAINAIAVFFVLRMLGRFMAQWLLARWHWSLLLAIFSAAILLCYLFSLLGGVQVAVWLMPCSGLFMSIFYPTLNSKGISCFPPALHGSVAGLLLAFTALAAALGPLAMGLIADSFNDLRYGFCFALLVSALLTVAAWWNYRRQPAKVRLQEND